MATAEIVFLAISFSVISVLALALAYQSWRG